MKRFLVFILTGFFLIYSLSACSSSVNITSEELISKLKSTYSSMNSFHETSICITKDIDKNTESKVETDTYYSKPNFLKITSLGIKNKALIVSDGSDLFVNFNDSKDVNVRPTAKKISMIYSRLSASSLYSADSVVNEFFLMDGRFPSDYVIKSEVEKKFKKCNGINCYVLNISFETGVKQSLLIDSERFLILENKIDVYSLLNSEKLLFSSDETMNITEVNPNVDKKIFAFDTKGKNILKAGEMQKKLLASVVLKDKKAPEFKLPDIDSKEISLSSDLKGKNVFVIFWDPLYKPAFDDIRELGKIKKEFGDKIEIVGISSDSNSSERKAVFKKCNADFFNLYDAGAKIADSYYVNVVPHTVLISKDGIVIAEMPGTQGREAFLKALELAKK